VKEGKQVTHYRTRTVLCLAALAAFTVGCKFIARGPDQYREDTRNALQSKLPEVKACYDNLLKADKTTAGAVKVKFTVKCETGVIESIAVDQNGSSAPPALQECVTRSMQNVVLDPADARDGHATFTYEFTVG